ncbi:TIGR01212 family radical SAM protein [Oscillospiraceae bacterium LTW-04]|nr:TIGR01212 family radical SAM protein [Oscillospiraceae bacterium MB24-C1]
MQYLNGKRYYTMAQYCRERFGSRIVKISLNSGLSCPNRDGVKGTGGCTFCSGGTEAALAQLPLSAQYHAGLTTVDKWRGAKPVAYFQSFSNTYAPIERVEALLNEAIALHPAGIRLATRADCIDRDMAELLVRFSEKTVLELELGLQTVHDATAQAINRGHTFEEFCSGFRLLKQRKIYVCVHLINGLPQETPDMMLTSAKILAALRPDGIKLHMLHVLSGTPLAEIYRQHAFPLLSQQEYVAVVCSQLRYFHPETVIERLTGDGDRRTLIAPIWTRNKRSVLNAIDGALAHQNIWQGDLWEDR